MEDLKLPKFVLTEREQLLAEIYEVFPGGSRLGGVSWSEAEVIDLYGSPQDRIAAQRLDKDSQWQDVLNNPKWDPDTGVGGWSFLDAIGFRYYLPAGMVRSVLLGIDAGIAFHLLLPEGELREWQLEKWSLLNAPQRQCVRRFIEYMSVVRCLTEDNPWTEAFNSFWVGFPEIQ